MLTRSSMFVWLSMMAGCVCGPDSTVGAMPDGGGATDGGQSGGAGGGQGAAGGTGGGGMGAGDDGGCTPALFPRFRDFHDTHPDFEKFSGNGAFTGLVESTLGPDNLPVYAPAGPTAVTSGKANFDQWYRDVPGVNVTIEQTLPLTAASGGRFIYDSSAFFPLDGLGFGNEGRAHNFHFTTEVHASFVFHGGEVFTFRGDDDVWVFVNKKLAVDLGGLHQALAGTITFDQQATALGLVVGQRYPLDIFQAERHTSESNFRVETTIECLEPQIN